MVYCLDCGMQLKSREQGDVFQVYDVENETWSEICPNCGYDVFDEDGEFDFEDDEEQ